MTLHWRAYQSILVNTQLHDNQLHPITKIASYYLVTYTYIPGSLLTPISWAYAPNRLMSTAFHEGKLSNMQRVIRSRSHAHSISPL